MKPGSVGQVGGKHLFRENPVVQGKVAMLAQVSANTALKLREGCHSKPCRE